MARLLTNNELMEDIGDLEARVQMLGLVVDDIVADGIKPKTLGCLVYLASVMDTNVDQLKSNFEF